MAEGEVCSSLWLHNLIPCIFHCPAIYVIPCYDRPWYEEVRLWCSWSCVAGCAKICIMSQIFCNFVLLGNWEMGVEKYSLLAFHIHSCQLMFCRINHVPAAVEGLKFLYNRHHKLLVSGSEPNSCALKGRMCKQKPKLCPMKNDCWNLTVFCWLYLTPFCHYHLDENWLRSRCKMNVTICLQI